MPVDWDEAFEELADLTRATNDRVAADPKYQEKVARERAKIEAGIGVEDPSNQSNEDDDAEEDESEAESGDE